MYTALLKLAFLLLVTLASPPSLALPIELSRPAFTAAISGMEVVVEDFEPFIVAPPDFGRLESPVTLANATYISVFPQIRDQGTGTKQLFEDFPDPEEGRLFSLFPEGTTLFGADVATYVPQDSEVLWVQVTGGSGTVTSIASFAERDDFFAVVDPLGLTSIRFRNLGDLDMSVKAWGIDNVTTGRISVPNPPAIALVCIALVSAMRLGGRL